jgi:ATP-binding cassette subfamily B protein
MKRLNLLYQIIEKRKLFFLSAILLMMVSIFIRTIEPKIIQVLIDDVLKKNLVTNDYFTLQIGRWLKNYDGHSDFFKLGLLCAFYLSLAAIRSIFILTSRAISYRSAELSMQNFRTRIFEHIQKIPMSSFNILNKGELIQRSTGDIDTIKNFISNHTIELIRLTMLFSFTAYMLIQINAEYAIWCLSLCPFIFFSTYIFFNYEGKVWQEHEDEADKLTNIAQENLNGIRTVKAFGQMNSEIEKFNIQNNNKFKVGIKHVKLHTFFWPFNDALLYLQTTIFIIVGGIFVLQGKLSLGSLIAAYAYNTMLGFPLKQAGRILSQMSMAFVAIDRIEDILTIPREVVSGREVKKLNGNIKFEEVSFRYKEEGELVLNNINFEVKKGERVAIMGSSASGKSSLMKLLLRLYEPSSGKILIDGVAISDYKLTDLRHRIGYVMQQSVLFSMDIKENLAYANESSSLDDKIHKLSMAGFENYETVLPKGLETEIGEKGVSLSGGQKQRLSLARTLIKDNDILILDDITSALDKETEKRVLDNVFRYHSDKTLFIITHRISTLAKVDKVLVLDDRGRIQSYGQPEEIKKTDNYLITLDKIERNSLDTILLETSKGSI